MTTKALQRSIGSWKLPQPLDVKEDGEWIPLPRIARTIPFGYELDEDDDKVLLPIETELNTLAEAKKHLKKYSYREVSNWLSTRTGRYISHVGLMKRVRNERKRKNKANSLRKWAAYVEETLAKAEELENERLDARTDVTRSGATEEPTKD
jgi:hypothetical protein|tara:strand:- start:1159 stop:1611 length:453 start_codon:yes stop_codon:yes gene_type:complete